MMAAFILKSQAHPNFPVLIILPYWAEMIHATLWLRDGHSSHELQLTHICDMFLYLAFPLIQNHYL